MDTSRIHDKAAQTPAPAEKSAIVQAGQAMSNPGEAGHLRQAAASGKADTALAQFTPSEHLLKGLGESSATKAASSDGPQFPLTKSYDPEANYKDASGKPTPRGEELQKEALKMVDAVAHPDGSLSLKDHAKMMDQISKMNISEGDKWYLYKQIHREELKGRNAEQRLIPGTKEHRVSFDEAPPTGLPRSGKGDVVRHIIIDPTDDAYHGGLVYGSRTMSAGFLRGEGGIFMHEDVAKPIENWHRGEGFGVNRGDEQASQRQLRALKAMQGENGQPPGFNSYAKAWISEFGH